MAAQRARGRADQADRGGAPRVLLVESELADDGASRSNLRLVSRWRAGGAPVVLFALQRSRRPATVPAGVVVTHPSDGSPRLRWALLLGLLRLVRLARGADVVVAGRELDWGLLVGRLAAAAARRPFVVLVRAEPAAAIEQHVSPRWRRLTLLSLRTATRVVCISPGLVSAVEAVGVAPGRVTTVLNGVDVAAVRQAGSEPATILPGLASPVVVGVGRLDRQKGFDTLVRVHARVVAAGQPHTLLLLGEGEDREELRRLAAGLGVAGSVVMPGFTTHPLPEVAGADLFCLSSRWEGFGQGLAEALVLGTPVVATDCVSGPRDLLRDGRHGDLVPVDDVDAMTSAVQRHLRDPGRLREKAQRGQEWAASRLDVDRTAVELRAVLASCSGR